MRLMLTLPLLLAFGCAEAVELSLPHPESTGSDTGASGGDEDDESTPEDDDEDGIEAYQGCGPDEMVWEVEVRTPDGEVVHMTTPDQELVLVGRVHNPCLEPVTLELPGSCMVEAFDVISTQSGEGEYESLECLETGRRTELPPEGCDETTLPWGTIRPGEYEVTAHFSIDGRRASTELVVQ